MMKFYLLLIILGFYSYSQAQKVNGTVKGVLRDSASSQPLQDATVSIINAQDSSLVSFTISLSDGSFSIKNIPAGRYLLIASFTGLSSYHKSITVSPQSSVIDLGSIVMSRNYKTLDEVVINEAPIKVNGDTLAFKADAFKTKPNATVEDLLKKMPGMTVDRDGTVKAQGEQVQKVYVDGKEFFNNDPKLATKNLTADMIDQVEVFDDMSEQAKFNKIDDGSRSRAINLKLKKDKKKGIFGKAYAGYGTDDRTDEGLNANFFKGATQTSVIAKANNTNNLGFITNDMMGMFNGNGGGGNIIRMGGQSGGGSSLNQGTTGSGITTSSQAGLNYRDTWSKFFEVNGSYFYNHAQTENFRKDYRQTFLSDSTFITNDQGHTLSRNDNQRLNLNMIFTIDSFNSVIYNPNLSFQHGVNNSNDSTLYSYNVHGVSNTFNESRTLNESTGNMYNWQNNLIWRRKFRKAGRTLSVTFNNTLSNSGRDNYSDINARINPRNYYTNSVGNTNNYNTGFSYTEPLALNKILEFNYTYSKNNNESDKESFDYNVNSGKYDQLNDSLTNHFKNYNQSQRFGTNFRFIKKKYNFQIGVAAQETELQSDNLSRKTILDQHYVNIYPTASFNYQFARSRSLRFSYRGRTNQPSITQLQDVTDISNYPYLSRGNPALKQEFSNNFTLFYNFFDVVKFRNVFAFISFNNTFNKIENSVSINKDGSQLTIPVNLSGYYSMNGNFNYGIPIQKLKGGNFNTTTRVMLSNDPSLYNGAMNNTQNLNIGQDLRLNYNFKEKLDMGIMASLNYNSVHYTTRPNQNQSYYTHNYTADITWTMPKDFILSTDFDYVFNTGRVSGYNQNYAIWNAAFARELFKNKRGELRLSVFDILNQNVSVTRNVGANYIEDVQNSVLQRFFMLSFIYRINRMGGKSMQGMNRGDGRGMRRFGQGY